MQLAKNMLVIWKDKYISHFTCVYYKNIFKFSFARLDVRNETQNKN